jgi:hypothetical protein
LLEKEGWSEHCSGVVFQEEDGAGRGLVEREYEEHCDKEILSICPPERIASMSAKALL